MSFTTQFDTLFDFTGEMTMDILDPDQTPNRVLDINQPWDVKVKWILTSQDVLQPVNMIAGSWDVQVYYECVSAPLAAQIAPTTPTNYLYNQAPPNRVLNATEGVWVTILNIPVAEIPQAGLYRITVMLNFLDGAGIPTAMAGFAEYPMVRFR